MDFETIFDSHFDSIYNRIFRMVKNEQDAEDISQEVFFTVFKNLKKFKGESGLYTWIYKIAINKACDFFRKRKITFELNEEMLYYGEESIMAGLEIKDILEKMSGRERVICVMHDIYGYKFNEISNLTGISLSTVKTWYYDAKKRLEKKNG